MALKDMEIRALQRRDRIYKKADERGLYIEVHLMARPGEITQAVSRRCGSTVRTIVKDLAVAADRVEAALVGSGVQ